MASFPIDIPLATEGDPTMVLARVMDTDNPSSPSQSPVTLPDWTVVLKGSSRFLRINNIIGLTSGHNYSVSVVYF